MTRAKIMSNFRIAITPLILELERRSTAQNAGNDLGYLVNITYFLWHFSEKSELWSHYSVASKKILIQYSFYYTSEMKKKTICKTCMKIFSNADDVSDDVTEWRQSRPSKFMFKLSLHICFAITLKRFQVWSSNFMYRCSLVYEHVCRKYC